MISAPPSRNLDAVVGEAVQCGKTRHAARLIEIDARRPVEKLRRVAGVGTPRIERLAADLRRADRREGSIGVACGRAQRTLALRRYVDRRQRNGAGVVAHGLVLREHDGDAASIARETIADAGSREQTIERVFQREGAGESARREIARQPRFVDELRARGVGEAIEREGDGARRNLIAAHGGGELRLRHCDMRDGRRLLTEDESAQSRRYRCRAHVLILETKKSPPHPPLSEFSAGTKLSLCEL